MDGLKLHLFAIFNGTPVESIDRQLLSMLTAGILGCVQSDAWMEGRTMEIWSNKISKLYIGRRTGNFELYLDDFICHKSGVLKQKRMTAIQCCT